MSRTVKLFIPHASSTAFTHRAVDSVPYSTHGFLVPAVLGSVLEWRVGMEGETDKVLLAWKIQKQAREATRIQESGMGTAQETPAKFQRPLVLFFFMFATVASL